MISNAVKHGAAGALAAACLALGCIAPAHAVPVSVLAMKLSDSSPATSDLPAWEGWRDAGGFNEDNAAAQLLIDNGLDYKNGIVDTNWADVLSVRVSMYRLGVEQKFIQFSPGTTKMNFFTAANVTASSYLLSDLRESHNFFSIQGDSGIDRHWFINEAYPAADPTSATGWFSTAVRVSTTFAPGNRTGSMTSAARSAASFLPRATRRRTGTTRTSASPTFTPSTSPSTARCCSRRPPRSR